MWTKGILFYWYLIQCLRPDDNKYQHRAAQWRAVPQWAPQNRTWKDCDWTARGSQPLKEMRVEFSVSALAKNDRTSNLWTGYYREQTKTYKSL